MLFIVFMCLLLLIPVVSPKKVRGRFKATFVGGATYNVMGYPVTIDESASLRIKSWQGSIRSWLEYPIFGRGVPGGGVVADVQYPRVLREVGIVGFLAFMWMIARLVRLTFQTYANVNIIDFGRGLSLGFLCSMIGLLVMGVATEIFIIIRIMEPFWFLAAIVVSLPELSFNGQNENIWLAT